MMKKIFAFLLMFGLTACASDRITLTLTVTNTPAGLNTFVVNGNTRTWTNAATASPSTLVLIGASIGASATNLFRQIASYPYSGPLDLAFSSSNVITLRGQQGGALAASISGTWATLSYSTQTVATLNVVRVPASSEPTQSTSTNIQSQLALDLGTHSTNALAAGTTLVQNIVQTTGTQTIAGDKTLSGATSIAALTAGAATINGAFTLSSTSPTMTFYDSNGAVNEKYAQIDYNGGALKVYFWDDAFSSVGNALQITRSGITVADARFFGPLRGTTLHDTTITANTIGASNIVTAGISFTRANHTALANGDNAGVSFGDKVFAKIKTGPSAAFAICGIAEGWNGRILMLYNSTGYDMAIKNNSGGDPTPANRILTGTGADITITGNGFVNLIYDSEDSLWVVMNYQP